MFAKVDLEETILEFLKNISVFLMLNILLLNV